MVLRGQVRMAPGRCRRHGTVARHMSGSEDSEHAAMIEVIVETMRSTVTVARALVDAGIRIDLDGLDREIGDLCADAVSLPRELGRTLIDPLTRLRDEIAALETTLAEHPPEP